jgi:hypothetical protein
LSVYELGQRGAARVHVRAEGGDDPDAPAAGEHVDGIDELLAILCRHPVLGEDLFHLVDDQRQARLRRAMVRRMRRLLGRVPRQRRLDQGHGGGGGRLEDLGELLRAGVVEMQAVLAQQGRGEADEQVAAHVAGPEHCAAPVPHALDDARLREHRQHAGARQGGLAAAAHAEHEHEGASGGRLAAQQLQHVADRLGAAEEDRRMLVVETLQAPER